MGRIGRGFIVFSVGFGLGAVLLGTGCQARRAAVSLPDAGLRPVVVVDGSAAGADAAPTLLRPDGGPVLPPADQSLTLPYLGATHQEALMLDGVVGQMDVFLLIDTTGSFGGEIDALQNDLRGRIVPELRARVADIAFGVGRFEDFPVLPFGAENDLPFALLTPITTDEARIDAAVAALDQPLGHGGDPKESGAEALYQVATGEGYREIIEAFSDPGEGGGRGAGVGFRAGALRVVVHVTDAEAHAPDDYGTVFPGTRDLSSAIAALEQERIRVIGVSSGAAARRDLEAVAHGTGSVIPPVSGQCPTGLDGAARAPVRGVCPLVFDVRPDGTGLADTIVDGITDLLSVVTYDEVWGEVDDGLGFVQAVEAVSAEAIPPASEPERSDQRPADGTADTFVDVSPGVSLRFVARLQNRRVPPADYDQFFRVRVRVVGDGITLLSQALRITVPAGRLDGG